MSGLLVSCVGEPLKRSGYAFHKLPKSCSSRRVRSI